VIYKRTQAENVVTIGYGKHVKDLVADLLRISFYKDMSNYLPAIKLIFSYLKKKMMQLYWRAKPGFNLQINKSRYAELKPLVSDASTIILHSMYEIFTPGDIARLGKESNIPIYIRPLDMEPITGGCHFNFGCDRYADSCGDCPQLGLNLSKDISCINQETKRKIYHNASLHWVAVNSYAHELIRKSSVCSSHHAISKIFLGVESERCNEISKKQARLSLGLHENCKIILFGCFDFMDERKGAQVLKSAFLEWRKEGFSFDDCQLITFGSANGFSFNGVGIEWVHFGYVNEDEEMNFLYRAADVYASPSVDDIGPTTVSEAFMNGCPTVSFDIGIAMDILIEGKSGNLVSCYNEKTFGQVLYKYMVDDIPFVRTNEVLELQKMLTAEYEACSFLELDNL